ncbi:MAG: PilZ domain-containing protein [Desulfobacter sp.]|nr:MAG: PilZ domain-containing protein [Desulfobacter sp.]
MVTKIYVNADLKATIPCPNCKNSYQKDVSRFIKHHKEVRLKYTCKCKHQFSILLERRRFIRKEKQLNGYLIEPTRKLPLRIIDISKYGIKIKLFTKAPPDIGSILTIEFILDDPGHSKVTTKVTVKRVLFPDTLGCEFLNPNHYDNLGKYFLFHF